MKKTFLAIVLGLFLAVGCEKPVDDRIPFDPGPEKPETPAETPWPADATVVGSVSAGGVPIKDAVVSDGYLVTRTDGSGRFSLRSSKRHGYVFVSVPSGYETTSSGVLPQFYAYVGKHTVDTVDFKLSKAEQKSFSVYLLGDIHLADKRRDISQFADFAADLNSLRSGREGFAVTLGDMSWDAYWDGFDLEDYLSVMNRSFPGLKIFHTIGNHDHELGKAGDWETAVAYKRVIGPTYYSFNAGGVHFIVLDDILCRNTADGQRSSWNEVDDEQMDWLAADLSFVAKSTPVVVAMHAPLYSDSGSFSLYNGWDLAKCFTGFEQVYFFSGHTHVCYNNDYQKPGYIPIFEGNSGAVCGAWWYTVYDFPKEKVHICPDGTPGGYRVLEVNDGRISWFYKGTGRDRNYQFRTYDRNSICLSSDRYVPNAGEADRKGFETLVSDYGKPSADNYVLLNIWDYDPRWTVSVSENGKPLAVERLTDKRDPLYLSSFEAYSFDKGYTTEYSPGVLSSYYPSSTTGHLFRVQASSASSTLEISVKDRFGREYTETMTRPKEFRLEY